MTRGVRLLLQVDWHRSDSVGSIPTAVKRSLWYTRGQDAPPHRSHSPSHLQPPADALSHSLQKRGSANSLVEAVSEKKPIKQANLGDFPMILTFFPHGWSTLPLLCPLPTPTRPH